MLRICLKRLRRETPRLLYDLRAWSLMTGPIRMLLPLHCQLTGQRSITEPNILGIVACAQKVKLFSWKRPSLFVRMLLRCWLFRLIAVFWKLRVETMYCFFFFKGFMPVGSEINMSPALLKRKHLIWLGSRPPWQIWLMLEWFVNLLNICLL